MSRGSLVASAALALSACTNAPPVFAPIIDQPVNPGASAFPLDEVTMELAHNGSSMDLASATFTTGQTPELAGVPFADDLVVHLTGYVGQQEVAYGRTCAVAITANAPMPQPHLYFSESVKFGQLEQLPASIRFGGSAMTDDDGGGVVLGGVDGSGAFVSEVERFDPLTGGLTSMYASLSARTTPAVATLGSGTALLFALIGGLDPNTNAGAQFVELVSPLEPTPERRVNRIEDGQMARLGLTATALSDGSVIVIGGQATPMSPPSGEVDQVVLANGTASISPLRAQLLVPRINHSATRLGNDVGAPVLIAGGTDLTGAPIAQAELYKPLAQAFSATFSANMVHPRSHHQAVEMPDGSVLFVGGLDGSGNPVTEVELFTQDGGFSTIQQLPPDAGVIDFAATRLPDGRVLFTGGRLTSGGAPVNTAYIATLDPLGLTVDLLATNPMNTPRAQHQATLLCDGTVIVSGGTTTGAPLERYNPPPDGRR